jgi:hypothetical protein
MIARRNAVLIAGLIFTALPAHGRFRVQIPIPVRITAYVNEKLEGIKPDYEWLVADRQTEYTLYILQLTVLTGGVLPGDIDSAVAPFRVKFQLVGQDSALQAFKNTPPRQQIVITGYLQFAGGARILMLDKVEGAAPPTAAPK